VKQIERSTQAHSLIQNEAESLKKQEQILLRNIQELTNKNKDFSSQLQNSIEKNKQIQDESYNVKEQNITF
jgi:hypothetical protein